MGNMGIQQEICNLIASIWTDWIQC